MLIEYASFDMQKAIGNGVVNKTDDGSTSMTEITGATVNLGNASGSVTNINGYNIVSYRGEENIWGNIWAWIDGMNEENPATFTAGDCGTLYVADHGFGFVACRTEIVRFCLQWRRFDGFNFYANGVEKFGKIGILEQHANRADNRRLTRHNVV